MTIPKPTCLWRWNRQSVPKRRHIKFRRRGITQKKTYNIQNTAKVWNQERFMCFGARIFAFMFHPIHILTTRNVKIGCHILERVKREAPAEFMWGCWLGFGHTKRRRKMWNLHRTRDGIRCLALVFINRVFGFYCHQDSERWIQNYFT